MRVAGRAFPGSHFPLSKRLSAAQPSHSRHTAAPGSVVLDADDDPQEARPIMFGSLLSRGSRAELNVNVWLNPAPGRSAAELARVLGRVAHLVVVPKTGSRRADVAVLLDPDPVELAGVARVLPDTPLLAATSGPPPAALSAAARRVGAHLLPHPTPEQLAEKLRLLCRPAAYAPAHPRAC